VLGAFDGSNGNLAQGTLLLGANGCSGPPDPYSISGTNGKGNDHLNGTIPAADGCSQRTIGELAGVENTELEARPQITDWKSFTAAKPTGLVPIDRLRRTRYQGSRELQKHRPEDALRKENA
jgi:hypothetical protein